MKLAIFGGSFDPPHQGHAEIVRSFWQSYPESNKLYFIPNRLSPFKTKKNLSPQQTLEICQLFLQDLPGNNEIWPGELQKTGKSYTIDTILALQKQHPNSKLSLLIGADTAQSIQQWKDSQHLLQLCQIIVFRRPGIAKSSHSYPELDNTLVAASSSEIRQQLAQKHKPEFLSSKVYEYILSRGLYETTTCT